MKKFLLNILSVTLIATLALTGCASGNNGENNVNDDSNPAQSSSKKNIGIVQLVEHEDLDASCNGFLQALEDNRELLEGANVDIDKIDFQNAQNDNSNLSTISQKFVSEQKDLVLAIATAAGQSMASETSTIPILITAVTDPVDAQLANSIEEPGKNVTGTSDLVSIEDQIELFNQLGVNPEKLAVFYNSGEPNSALQADLAIEAADARGIETARKTISSTNDIAQVLDSIISEGFDGIYIPTDNSIASSMALVSSVTAEAKIPVVVGSQSMCQNGALATLGINYFDLGYITGEMAVEILVEGKEPKNMPIRYGEDVKLMINASVAEQIGLELPEDLEWEDISPQDEE